MISSEHTRLHINYTRAHNTNQEIRITAAGIDDFRRLNSLLIKSDLPIHTYALKKERKLKAVLKGIPLKFKTEDIKLDLEKQGYPVLAVHRMHPNYGGYPVAPKPKTFKQNKFVKQQPTDKPIGKDQFPSLKQGIRLPAKAVSNSNTRLADGDNLRLAPLPPASSDPNPFYNLVVSYESPPTHHFCRRLRNILLDPPDDLTVEVEKLIELNKMAMD
ncbi:hypothetical protein EVAR_77756_1 [Eumeta japonica]|uniref:Nucleic-acid-binding protein from transposon X-element n=1 Tax=Eumeta variegata TaxID=151549 RepID=A0A4C1TE01_EUMVA|nr:hypothetical protein EVAR_77756_1 [Eumeta japonica]